MCLSDTPIENIENCFVPPDVPKDMLNMDKNEIDDVWIDFLTEFTKPLCMFKFIFYFTSGIVLLLLLLSYFIALTNEDDDDADPEYNAAVEKEKCIKIKIQINIIYNS